MTGFYDWPPIGGKKMSFSKPTIVPIEMLTLVGEVNDEAVKSLAAEMRMNGYPKDEVYPEVTWSGKAFNVVLGKTRVAAAKVAGLVEIPVRPDRAVLKLIK